MLTLVLNAEYQAHDFVSWRDAAELLYKGRAEVVELYGETVRVISREALRAISGARQLNAQMLAWFEMGEADDGGKFFLHVPAVIRLIGQLGRKWSVKFSRINVLTRDNWTCQYCGKKKRAKELNYDHVIPRSRGGKTVWENIVMACYGCNSRKRDLTPSEAGMRLLKKPVRPRSLPIRMSEDEMRDLPSCLRSWLYWNVELEP